MNPVLSALVRLKRAVTTYGIEYQVVRTYPFTRYYVCKRILGVTYKQSVKYSTRVQAEHKLKIWKKYSNGCLK